MNTAQLALLNITKLLLMKTAQLALLNNAQKLLLIINLNNIQLLVKFSKNQHKIPIQHSI